MLLRRFLSLGAVVGLGAAALVGIAPSASAGGFFAEVGDCVKVKSGNVMDEGAVAEVWIPTCASVNYTHNAQVYAIAPYPADFPKPSALGKRKSELWDLCSDKDFNAFFGLNKPKMPITISRTIVMPRDIDWESEGTAVVCIAVLPDSKGQARSFTGKLPELFAASPLMDWVYCAKSTPKSGTWTAYGPCGSRSKWLAINGVMVKGQVTSKYPKDLQAKADKLCADRAKSLLKPGASTAARAALWPKQSVKSGPAYADCFIALSDWTGKIS